MIAAFILPADGQIVAECQKKVLSMATSPVSFPSASHMARIADSRTASL